MQAHENRIRQLLDCGQQFIVPLFQRFYVWETKYWETLWDDLIDLIEDQGLINAENRVRQLLKIVHSRLHENLR